LIESSDTLPMNKPQRRNDAERKTNESGKQESRKKAEKETTPRHGPSASCFPAFLIRSSASPRLDGSFSTVDFRARLARWFGKNARDLPWRRTREPYAILVSEIMLQQTQVATVVPFYERWMRRFPDVAALADADENEALRFWQGLGYYSRARNLHRAARAIIEQHDGEFPRALEQIRALPGVGRYTAGAVTTFAFNEATPIVDANIARVLARIFDVQIRVDSSAGQRALWRHAADLQPRKNARLFNGALMELGALVCVPRAPKCPSCPVARFCRAQAPEHLPIKRARRETKELIENCALIIARGKILLEQQAGPRWRGLWKLPALAISPGAKPLLQLEYPFTHHRVKLAIFKNRLSNEAAQNQRWHRLCALDAVAISAPHRRAITALLA
jgi:A/G-specific adenine glycosylase